MSAGTRRFGANAALAAVLAACAAAYPPPADAALDRIRLRIVAALAASATPPGATLALTAALLAR